MLQPPSAEQAGLLREFFRKSDYTTKTLMTRFGLKEVNPVHLLKLYRRGADFAPDALNLLLQWFWIGKELEESLAAEHIPEDVLRVLVDCGLLRCEGGRLVSDVRIAPFADLLVASDHAESMESDTILWPNPTTLLNYHFAIRQPVERTLDLGTGTGILAIGAARHSGEVIATDLNARAREFVQFNAALNGVANVEFREGNSFEPVRGEKFDLILANPPFFVSPTLRRVYSDNDMELDGFCRTLIRQAPGHLNQGGYCQMLIEWVEVRGQAWRERLREWLDDAGCDAWVINTYTRTASDYAIIRVQEDREDLDLTAQAAVTAQWQRYFEERAVVAVHGGVVMMRRRDGKNWVRTEELPVRPERPFGDYLRQVFETQDFLEMHPDVADLLDARPMLHASSVLQKRLTMSDEGWAVRGIEIRLSEGLPYSIALQPTVADFLGACDGRRTLREVAAEIGAGASASPEAVLEECSALVRQLAQRGFCFFAAG